MAAVLTDRRARIQTSPLRHLDLGLLVPVFAITFLGLVMIYSATRDRLIQSHASPTYYLERQVMWVAVGIVVMVVVMLIDYHKLRDLALVGYGALVLMLLVVLSPLGKTTLGAQERIDIGAFALQPSEFAKFFMILILAAYCAQHRGALDRRHLLVALVIAGIPLGLVMLQPDLGTALVLGSITFLILALAGARGRHLAVLALLLITCSVGAIRLGVLKPYQVQRLTAFLDQAGDRQASTYNLQQSKTAIGNGGLLGKGLFRGTQTNLSYVPEQHTDFIFTAVGEELGFVGAATLLALFAIVVWRTWRTAELAHELYGSLLCYGVIAMLAFQVFENVGMTMGIMPITGIPLPFMSYGGSSAIVSFACIGLVANVHMRRFT